MAYATANPPCLISQRVGASSGALWYYVDGDEINTIQGADYVSNGYDLGMKAGDAVIVAANGKVFMCSVSSVTTDGAATIGGAAAGGGEILAAAKTLVAGDSGKTLFLNLAGGFTVTLPAPALGMKFKFVVSTAPTTAYVITTNGGDDIIIGGVNELEVDTGDDGPYDNNADTVNFVASVAVVGDYIELESDGTSWFMTGQTNADGGVTTSTT